MSLFPPRTFVDRAIYHDGQTAAARRIQVEVMPLEKLLVLHLDDGAKLTWPLDEVRQVPDLAGKDQLVLRRAGTGTERIIVANATDIGLIRATAPNLGRKDPVPQKGRILRWASAAVGAVALIIFVLVPVMADQLARFLPPEGEKALGDATLLQIRRALDETGFSELPICDSRKGTYALRQIERRLAANADLPIDLTVHVLDHPMVNAFALPGGHIVLFRGLIDEAETPEEVAAVFAHEMGHVEARDPTRIALRSAGSIGVLGLLFGDFAGGALVLFLTERLIQADYTREAEAAADAYAHSLLLAADLPPHGIATFFERLQDSYGDEPAILQHFLSHPEMGDRIAAARAATPAFFEGRQLLTETEWQALRAICDRY
ncbi:M48 family metallopeptidase [Loktanella sp. IMCC34160]|uniref:M48 family metallopeptidase n=1 Tax=Loktanella sp. IMCC34160 TaxID=2510646 RepID=UPI00101C9A81|nr:M48 family metallopeptidase [Loktanella sp. IMCC34160]RYG92533.1 M48 family metallopeptidase [Loktanella sp. IMCC34160]